ncbi:Phd_YefM [Legionella beliardensis]|uniref:Antitoxin n=1 Tax=Legionella beliardensis TaxID=91822 RepID=A0A378I618_9GAMM|nr:type II toxin-antitoxin system Phd/YefM family antitoxin [Legionella beliardensis]STX27914.1 Phd_YefM [Legionella beliardensis]
MIKIVTSREFNQDVSKIRRDARNEPVFITDRGRAAHVLMSIQDYEKLISQKETIVDLLAMAKIADIDFEPEKLSKKILYSEEFDYVSS